MSGKLIRNKAELEEYIEGLRSLTIGEYGLFIEVKDRKQTSKQRSAEHVFFGLLATALNDAGLDMKTVMKPEASIPWTKESVKENLWKPILKAMTKKRSTEDQTRVEVNQVYEVLMGHLSEKFGVYVPFPQNQYPTD